MALTERATIRNARRTRRRLFTLTLTQRVRVSANTTRFTFVAPELGDFEPLGPDEFFALVIPPRGGDLPELTLGSDDDPRAAIRALPVEVRPAVRWYTVRAHRPDRHEIDVDMVLHGDTGPASTWGNHAAVGARVGFREANAPYLAPEAGHQLLVADETALPALAAILESAPTDLAATVLVEVPTAADLPPIHAPVPITVVHRGDRSPGSALLPALQRRVADGLPELGYAWLCGEAAIATGARRLLVRRLGVDPAMIMFSGYWRLGQARE